MPRFFRRSTLWPIVLLVAACSDGGDELPMSEDPAARSVAFGRLPVGATIVQELSIASAPTDVVLEPADGAFRVVVGAADASGARPLRIEFRPVAPGDFSARLVLLGVDPSERAYRLTGEGRASQWRPDPARVDFGPVLVDAVAERVVTLRHDERRALTAIVEGLPPCPGRDAPFCVQAPAAAVEPGGEETLTVRFTPTAAQPYSARFTLGEVEVTVTGDGVEGALECPPNFDFGAVNPGACIERAVECRAMLSTSVTAEVAPPLPFTVDPDAPTAVEAGEVLSLGVTYCGSADGAVSAVLRVTADADARMSPIVLSGRSGGPDVVTSSVPADIGLVGIGFPRRLPLLVTNRGNDVLVLQTPDDGQAMSVQGPSVVEPGQTVEMALVVEPVTAGPGMATARLLTNDVDTPRIDFAVGYTGVAVSPCRLSIPDAVEFGTVPLFAVGERTVRLENLVDAECLVYGVEVDENSAFRRPRRGAGGAQLVPPSGAFELPIELVPETEGPLIGRLRVNVAGTPAVQEVQLGGFGSASPPVVFPNVVDFGVRSLDCAGFEDIRVHLQGRQRLVSAVVEGDPGLVVSTPELPSGFEGLVTLEAGFTASRLGAARGLLRLTFEDRAGARESMIVDLRGRVQANAPTVDSFVQLDNPAVDTLMVLDHSGGSSTYRLWVGSHADALVDFAEARGLDYHFGVTTTDIDGEAGRFCPERGEKDERIVSAATAAPADQIAANVRCRSEAGGASIDESPLWATTLALSPDLIAGANAGFYRPYAALSLVIATEEAEQSQASVDFYLDQVRRMKGWSRRHDIVATIVSGPRLEGCAGTGGSAFAAPRLHEVLDKVGGEWWSLCERPTDMSEQFARGALNERRTFYLRTQAQPDSVRVWLDGVLQSVGWRYSSDAGAAVTFANFARPEPGQTIEVEYQAACLTGSP